MKSVITIKARRYYRPVRRSPRLTGMTMVTCSQLRFSYNDAEVVCGVDLDVRDGELFALLGTNGAGKTTTMELLRGERRPSGGTVRVLGYDPYRQRRQVAAGVGTVLQEGGCAPDLTVAETVRLWLRLRPAGNREKRAADVRMQARALIAETGLQGQSGVRVKQLSGGERRRLDLAVALCGEPRLLLLDEPTSGLDPQSRALTWTVLQERRRRGMTILFSTHYLEEAEMLADRVAILHAGQVAAAGTVAEVAGAGVTGAPRGAGSLAVAFERIAGGSGPVR